MVMEHLVDIHGGVGGGAYNTWWREFFAGQFGKANATKAFQWLDVHEANGFIIR